jgi:phage protein U
MVMNSKVLKMKGNSLISKVTYQLLKNSPSWNWIVNNVTHMIISRQRLGKHIPRVTLSTTEQIPGEQPIAS